jgi:2-methylcitrate dehydratase PrpD
MQHVERQLVEFIAGLSPADIPAETYSIALRALSDTFAVGIAGSATAGAGQVRRALLGSDVGRGTWSSAGTVSPASAALVNAYQVHCLEYDCVHEPAVVHALSVVTAAVTACAEALVDAEGTRFVAATVIGVDVASRLGVAARDGLRFFRPATAGVLGAAIGCGWLLGLDETELLNVLGLASSQVSGTMQAHVEASPSLPVQIGFAARAAVTAVDLARAGLPGARQSLFGPFGYFTLIENGGSAEVLLADLGARWLIDEISHKPFPSGRATHAAIELAQTMLHESSHSASEVQRVSLTAPPLVVRLAGRPAHAHMEPAWARLCIPYLTAHALRHGSVDLTSFTPAALGDRATLELASRVTVLDDLTTDQNALAPQTMTIEFTDGTRMTSLAQHLLGSPTHPMSSAQLRQKVENCVATGRGSASSAEELVSAVNALPQRDSLTALFSILQMGEHTS